MFSTLIIERDPKIRAALKTKLKSGFPEFKLVGTADDFAAGLSLLEEKKPDLLILDHNTMEGASAIDLSRLYPHEPEVIVLYDQLEHLEAAFWPTVSAYLKKQPLSNRELQHALSKARTKIIARKNSERNQQIVDRLVASWSLSEAKLLGIPTIKGLDFVFIKDIIRCEGLQKYTLIVMKGENSTIISSYNLGEFRKKLEPYGFYSPHKSHLINLDFIKHYHKEGSITMSDGSLVPVARRRKHEFLLKTNHL